MPGAKLRYGMHFEFDDRSLTGANPMHDENLDQILYALTEVTGNDNYKAQADQTLGWFFNHCQSTQTGLMAWGGEMYWDCGGQY